MTGICLGRVTPETEGTVRWLGQRVRGDISDVRGAAEGLAPQGSTVVATVSAPAPTATASPVARQWRYTSAVHAARVLRSR